MDFNDTPQEAAFRAEARAFLDSVAPRKQDPNQTWASIVEDKSADNIVLLAKEPSYRLSHPYKVNVLKVQLP